MGFVKDLAGAAYGAYEGALADSWLESISCSEYFQGELVKRGRAIYGTHSSNISRNPDVITDGSKIFVGMNETALVIENGEIINAFSESGEHVFHSEKSKGFFSGKSITEGLQNINSDAKDRFTFGGDKALVQRVLYINQREIPGNEFALKAIPIRVHVPDINYDVDCTCRLSGRYSFKIVDAIAFYKNFVGNIEATYYASSVTGLINTLLLTGIQAAIPKLFNEGIRPSAMVEYVEALAKAICEETTRALGPQRGIALVSCGISTFHMTGADLKMLQTLERDKVLVDPTMAAAHLVGATADAMEAIAYNANAGKGYALIGAALLKQREEEGYIPPKPIPHYWRCKCGKYASGKFCGNCGEPQQFECQECGAMYVGNFCPLCGTKRKE